MNLKANYIDRQSLETNIKEGLNQTTLLYVNLLCATIIACVGLNYNSTTTIIGAMLISPLMSAITGLGYGFGTANYSIVKKAGIVFGIQFLIIFLTALAFFWLTPIQELTSEISTRSTITIWDILVALLGGIALVVAKVRDKESNVIIGVSIGTSLILPLCASGYGFANQNFTVALDALRLFFLNMLIIGFVVVAGIFILGYAQKEDWKKMTAKSFYVSLGTLVVVTGALVYSVLASTMTEYNAKQFADTELADYYVLQQNIDETERKISLTLVGDNLTEEQLGELTNRLTEYNLNEYKLSIQNLATNGEIDAATLAKTLNEDNSGSSKFLGLD